MLALLIETLLGSIIGEGETLFSLKPKKDSEGYIHLKFPATFFAIPFLLFLVFILCLLALILGDTHDDSVLALCTCAILLFFTLLSFFYFKNHSYKFNNKEIFRYSILKKEEVVLWTNCTVKPMHWWWQQITISNTDIKLRPYRKLVGYRLLAAFIGKQFNLTPRQTGDY